tara:strand:- start:730 stop:1230 length:501 start_codon:yes stop_codon:yes gene_type:complete
MKKKKSKNISLILPRGKHISKSKENVKMGECGHPTDIDIKKFLDENYRPSWVTGLEVLVRKGQKLQAIKEFKTKEQCGLVVAKDAVEKYIETGRWNHYTFLRRLRLDQAFVNATGLDSNSYKEWYKINKVKANDSYSKVNQPLFTMDAVFAVAHEYLNVIRNETRY